MSSLYRSILNVQGGVDADAQAFITAASITDPTQQSAINQLVVDLKGYGVWTKMKSIYPFVGGTASSHKFNLKDPQDTDAAFRLVFSGGWTHSSTGATPNGTNAYADTKLSPSVQLSISSAHFSKYNRTNDLAGIKIDGIADGTPSFFQQNFSSGNGVIGDISSVASYTPTDTRGLITTTRTANNLIKVFRNSTQLAINTSTITAIPSAIPFIGARNNSVSAAEFFNSYECAFASIGDGLTDTEAANFYTAVQAFQTTLGRNIGTQTVSDADAQAFVTNAGIVDQVEANAINNLVIGLKADSLWGKMKAIYPFVGGTATTHKYNLVNPLDTDAAFRLVFNGGWTHSNTGATPNGTNGYANTYFNPTTQSLSTTSQHLSYYSRTNAFQNAVEIGVISGANNNFLGLYVSSTSGTRASLASSARYNNTSAPIDTRGLFTASRINGTDIKVYVNNTTQATQAIASTGNDNFNMYIGTYGAASGQTLWSSKQCAFASIGDGLTDTDATNLNTRVTTFQTTLNRQV